MARRSATASSIYKYVWIYDQSSTNAREQLLLADATTIPMNDDFMQYDVEPLNSSMTEKQIKDVVHCTTPDLEPSYLWKKMLVVALYVKEKINAKSQEVNLPPKEIKTLDLPSQEIEPPSGCVLILQGEVGLLEREEFS